MPASVIVGGQYGSEGKGKVALYVAESTCAAAVVRVGGPNSGHTAIDCNGVSWMFRQLPVSCLVRESIVVLPAGSLIDPDILRGEVEAVQLDTDRLLIDSHASVIRSRHRDEEKEEDLQGRIGSTASGTGAALLERISRGSEHMLAKDHPYLRRFTVPFAAGILRQVLERGDRVVVEGTQGFGLSIWHSQDYPNATSRDTTAGAFLSEAGLAPADTDDVVLVLRSFPIRVAGNSGPMPNEIDWPTLAAEAELPPDHHELTSATRRVRRVARFDSEIVRRAIAVNQPDRIVMNQLDYVDPLCRKHRVGSRGTEFIKQVEESIGRRIDLVGISSREIVEPSSLISAREEETWKSR